MNAPHPLKNQLTLGPAFPPPAPDDDDEINLAEYWDIVVDNRWLILAVPALALAVGGAYSVWRPVYESNLLIQVEDSGGSAKSFLGEAANLFDVKTPAAAEIEIIRSRMIVGQAVDNTALHRCASPVRTVHWPLDGSTGEDTL